MSFTTFVYSKLLDGGVKQEFIDSYEDLKPDYVGYIETDFVSRFRHFASFETRNGEIVENQELYETFNSVRDFHEKYDKGEKLPSIRRDLIENGVIQDFLYKIFDIAPVSINDHFSIGIHQVRVITDKDHVGDNAPGLHKDGYDYSCDLNISRNNVNGGITLLSTSEKEEDIFLEHTLTLNEVVFFNDRILYHCATKITPIDVTKKAYRDMVIIDFLRI